MKKKLLSVVLALAAVLSCATIAWAGAQGDTLITLSYLNGTYLAGLKTTVAHAVERACQPIYDAALAKAGQASGSGTSSGGVWLTSDAPVAGAGVYGHQITLATGSGLVWMDGMAAVSGGVLVDATVGAEVPVGGGLAAGHRYLAGETAQVVVSSQSAQWMIEGQWANGVADTVIVPLTFADVPSTQWYYNDVRYVVEKGLFQGLSQDTFGPNGAMQRCMMTTVLHRLAGKPEVGYAAVFTDIPDGQWYTQGTIWAAGAGVVSGMGDGSFAPGLDVTRQQIAVMLYNYAVKAGKPVGAAGSLTAFWDHASVAAWAQDAMGWAVGAGILNGSDGALLPNDSATRAQVAAMLHRFQNWMDQQTG